MIIKIKQEKLASFVRASRIARGITQKNLSDISNVSLKAIQKLEKSGDISTSLLLRLLMIINPNALNRMMDALTVDPAEYPMSDDINILKAINVATQRKPSQRFRAKG